MVTSFAGKRPKMRMRKAICSCCGLEYKGLYPADAAAWAKVKAGNTFLNAEHAAAFYAKKKREARRATWPEEYPCANAEQGCPNPIAPHRRAGAPYKYCDDCARRRGRYVEDGQPSGKSTLHPMRAAVAKAQLALKAALDARDKFEEEHHPGDIDPDDPEHIDAALDDADNWLDEGEAYATEVQPYNDRIVQALAVEAAARAELHRQERRLKHRAVAARRQRKARAVLDAQARATAAGQALEKVRAAAQDFADKDGDDARWAPDHPEHAKFVQSYQEKFIDFQARILELQAAHVDAIAAASAHTAELPLVVDAAKRELSDLQVAWDKEDVAAQRKLKSAQTRRAKTAQKWLQEYRADVRLAKRRGKAQQAKLRTR